MSKSERKEIVVTGFGPFAGHEEVNASWEAVQLLPEILVSAEGVEYQLIKRLVPVEYKGVDAAVAEIWNSQPELVIHCGVSGMTNKLCVEKLAYNHQFTGKDYAGEYLSSGSCSLSKHKKANVLRCGLDVDKIVQSVDSSCFGCIGPREEVKPKLQGKLTKVSKNVGNYLCGYIYLKSLDVNKERALFIHVPPIDKPFSTIETAEIIFKIIEQCVQQIESSPNSVLKCSAV